MTRKHFERIARAVRDLAVDKGAREEIAHRLADVCADRNSRFDRERFLRACGVIVPTAPTPVRGREAHFDDRGRYWGAT